MKARWFLIAATAACASSRPNHGAEEGAAPVKPHEAAGGGELVLAPIPGSATVAMRVLFYTGSIDDPPGKEGLTALSAQLVAEGGTERLSYPELLRELYPMAAEIRVQTDKEQTVFFGEVHVDHAERFAKLLAEVITKPRMPESDFTRIRQDMVNDIEKRLRATDDENLGKEMLNLMLYGSRSIGEAKAVLHPYAHYAGGTVKGLGAITLEDARAHRAKVLGKARALIGLGGSVSDAAKKILEDAVASLAPGAPRMAEIPRVAKPDRMEVLIAEKPGKAVAISMGYPHDAFRGHPDFSALGLVQSYFGEHRQFHGVLMSELRGKRGLNYGDYAYVESFIQEGWSRSMLTNAARRRQHFEIWIRPVDPKDAVFAIRAALFYLARLTQDGIPAANVRETREFLLGYTRLWDLTPSRKVGHALDGHFYGTPDYLDRYRRDLGALEAGRVNAAIAKHLVSGPLKIAIVAPNAEVLRTALISGAPSPKKYESTVPEDVVREDARIAVFPLGLTADNVHIVKADQLFVGQ